MTPTRWQFTNRNHPLDHFLRLRNEISQLLTPNSELWAESPFFRAWTPAVDLIETKEGFVARFELPGLKKEEIGVSLHKGTLTVSGERKSTQEAEQGQANKTELFTGKFQRTVALPGEVDPARVTAGYVDGILTVNMAKSEAALPKRIEIKGS